MGLEREEQWQAELIAIYLIVLCAVVVSTQLDPVPTGLPPSCELAIVFSCLVN